MCNEISISGQEYARLCRIYGRMSALIDFILQQEKKDRLQGYSSCIDKDEIKAIIGIRNCPMEVETLRDRINMEGRTK